VRAFLGTLKQVLEYVEVSDCNMEEGSLRADANVSVRPVGETTLETKTEIKNVNSFSGIERALEIEIARQIELRAAGGEVHGETLLWDDHRGTLRSMRSKEESHDYRYFPEPDLPALEISKELVRLVGSALPELPRARRARLESEYGIPAYDADVLTQTSATADYFEAVVHGCGDAKRAANWVMGPLLALVNSGRGSLAAPPVDASALAELIGLVGEGVISDGIAKRVLEHVADGEGSPREVVASRGLEQVRDKGALEAWVDEVIAEFPDEVARLGDGEGRLIGFLVGQVMRRSGGKADPRRVNELLRERLG
jgi:aspartyl-tRNA(Asn)/glutamyl-tRNA(Gln) amidotransferase subunit B